MCGKKSWVKHAKIGKIWTTSGWCHPGMFSRREILLELANNIMTILDNTEVRQNMGEMSLKIIREYTIEQMTKDHVKVLNSLIG